MYKIPELPHVLKFTDREFCQFVIDFSDRSQSNLKSDALAFRRKALEGARVNAIMIDKDGNLWGLLNKETETIMPIPLEKK